eukprot:scpid34788/ scgid22613/ Carnitine O-palmitoyltransferase 1, muscle isoform; Carnitine O-palmitoyltransferase I, muscle isoform; Carnitine palmitoyltransferase 1B; Carnitine palmitoyltransferase I-like protein
MAEARLAVAFQFSVTDEGNISFRVDRQLINNVLLSSARSAQRRFLELRNSVLRAIYPGSPWSLVLWLAVFTLLRLLSPGTASKLLQWWQSFLPFLDRLASPDAVHVVSVLSLALIVWISGLYIQRYVLIMLLYFKGYLYTAHGKMPLLIKLWFLCVKFVIGPIRPSLYTFQTSLPWLPLPSVEDTCKNYLRTVRPLMDDEKYEATRKRAEEFAAGSGRWLQLFLRAKHLFSSNYVSDWWEQYVYLRGRSPIMINSNYYILDGFPRTTNVQAARVGCLLHFLAKFKQDLELERVKPMLISNAVPLCMNQYKRVFGTTRLPGVEQDEIQHVPYWKSRHVAVMRRGRFYHVPLYYSGRILQPAELEMLIQLIIDDDAVVKDVPDGELHLPALTATDRTSWAKVRQSHFSSGLNQKSLQIVETAACVIVLEDGEPSFSPGSDTEVTSLSRSGLHGNGYNRWFDKSLTLAVYSNGVFVGNAEHSWADAPVIGHVFEVLMMKEHVLSRDAPIYGEDGHCLGKVSCPRRLPQRLRWNLPEACNTEISRALTDAEKLIADLDLYVLCHTEFGKGAVKKCRMSPDAFIQMALQLAYWRDIGKFSLTYEASMTRLFREGRTETVRPVSGESCAFVAAMQKYVAGGDGAPTAAEVQGLLRAAGNRHQESYRNAMAGCGVDRHLFTLYVVSKYLGKDEPFLQDVLSEPWRLSTSQTPYNQDPPKGVKIPDDLTGGGGFGPVADNGYGVSYIIVGEKKIFFHVSSKFSAEATSSERFAKNIRQAMRDMINLFEVSPVAK